MMGIQTDFSSALPSGTMHLLFEIIGPGAIRVLSRFILLGVPSLLLPIILHSMPLRTSRDVAWVCRDNVK